jgi:hypothetical protein
MGKDLNQRKWGGEVATVLHGAHAYRSPWINLHGCVFVYPSHLGSPM